MAVAHGGCFLRGFGAKYARTKECKLGPDTRGLFGEKKKTLGDRISETWNARFFYGFLKWDVLGGMFFLFCFFSVMLNDPVVRCLYRVVKQP